MLSKNENMHCVWETIVQYYSTEASLHCKVKFSHGLTAFSLYFSLHFNGHFPGGPGLAATRMSSFWILLELRMTEVVVTTGAMRRAKLHQNVITSKPTPMASNLL